MAYFLPLGFCECYIFSDSFAGVNYQTMPPFLAWVAWIHVQFTVPTALTSIQHSSYFHILSLEPEWAGQLLEGRDAILPFKCFQYVELCLALAGVQ